LAHFQQKAKLSNQDTYWSVRRFRTNMNMREKCGEICRHRTKFPMDSNWNDWISPANTHWYTSEYEC